MKSDLDTLMQAHNVDALLVCGATMHNPAMVYFTGVAHVSVSDLIKARGQEPVLFFNPMERDEAARTGLRTIPYAAYPREVMPDGNETDAVRVLAHRYRRMLADQGVEQGRVLVYGLGDAGLKHAVFRALEKLAPGLSIEADFDEKVLRQAMATKDADEVGRIRRMGEITVGVVSRVADFLSSQRARDGVLVDGEDKPITIGDVKQRINLWIAEAGAETPEDTIFAIGRDAAVPHSTGTPSDVLRLGQTIVFDIFPCEKGGGYFYDFTRTWCLGYAPDEALKLYEQVHSVYHQVLADMRIGSPTEYIQRRTCDLFEEMGHPTVLSDPATENGLCHSVGHGLGTYIHSRPWIRLNDAHKDAVQPGTVLTYEPGLYYPERGLGVRLEDTLYPAADGAMRALADYPMELVLPVRKV